MIGSMEKTEQQRGDEEKTDSNFTWGKGSGDLGQSH